MKREKKLTTMISSYLIKTKTTQESVKCAMRSNVIRRVNAMMCVVNEEL